jgi:quercetin dioxygenase-like cupin family protein
MSERNAFRRGLAAIAIAVGMAILASPALAIGPDLHVDVTPSSVPQEVQLVEHDLKKGQSSGWHIHHGVELAYVQQGHVAFNVGGQGPINLRAGGSIEIDRDTPHKATNVGPGRAILIISYLMDKGAPAAIPVPAPTAP